MSVLKRADRRTRIRPRRVLVVAAGVGLGLLLGGATESVYAVQGGLAGFVSLLALGYAFGAGMVAAVNPCGIVLLPALVTYYLGREQAGPALGRLGRALLLSIMTTAGFIVLFGGVGLILGAGGRALVDFFPFAGVLIGLIFAGLGTWLALRDEGLGIAAAGRFAGFGAAGGGLLSPFLFGVGYALASLACTLPVFLVVVGSALAAGSPAQAAFRFVSYALGMGLVLSAVIVATSVFHSVVTRFIRAVVPHVHTVAAALLVGSGVFLVKYWLEALGLLR
jgi:cytochrome c-type biogenesis protein